MHDKGTDLQTLWASGWATGFSIFFPAIIIAGAVLAAAIFNYKAHQLRPADSADDAIGSTQLREQLSTAQKEAKEFHDGRNVIYADLLRVQSDLTQTRERDTQREQENEQLKGRISELQERWNQTALQSGEFMREGSELYGDTIFAWLREHVHTTAVCDPVALSQSVGLPHPALLRGLDNLKSRGVVDKSKSGMWTYVAGAGIGDSPKYKIVPAKAAIHDWTGPKIVISDISHDERSTYPETTFTLHNVSKEVAQKVVLGKLTLRDSVVTFRDVPLLGADEKRSVKAEIKNLDDSRPLYYHDFYAAMHGEWANKTVGTGTSYSNEFSVPAVIYYEDLNGHRCETHFDICFSAKDHVLKKMAGRQQIRDEAVVLEAKRFTFQRGALPE
jgi:hypothetical protein